jgi:hypothetical protein
MVVERGYSLKQPKIGETMKTKLLLCLALVLSGGLFVCCNIAIANETNTARSYITATVKTNWTDAKVTVYRTMGGAVQLDAKREVATVSCGPYTNDVDVVAFIDPKTGNAWVGSSFGFATMFYLETESGITRGTVLFGAMALGAVRPDERDIINGSGAFGQVNWSRSLVPNVKRGENLDAAIMQLNKTNDLKSIATGMSPDKVTIIENTVQRIENGLNPWFFVSERLGSQFVATTIEAVDASDGKLRLDLKNPTGSHKASVWIDLKTWKVVKVIQDGNP